MMIFQYVLEVRVFIFFAHLYSALEASGHCVLMCNFPIYSFKELIDNRTCLLTSVFFLGHGKPLNHTA